MSTAPTAPPAPGRGSGPASASGAHRDPDGVGRPAGQADPPVVAMRRTGWDVRMAQAVQERDQRFVLLFSGVVTLVLGVMILDRWPESALRLLGTLLGVQIVVDGLLLMVFGRPRLTT